MKLNDYFVTVKNFDHWISYNMDTLNYMYDNSAKMHKNFFYKGECLSVLYDMNCRVINVSLDTILIFKIDLKVQKHIVAVGDYYGEPRSEQLLHSIKLFYNFLLNQNLL